MLVNSNIAARVKDGSIFWSGCAEPSLFFAMFPKITYFSAGTDAGNSRNQLRILKV